MYLTPDIQSKMKETLPLLRLDGECIGNNWNRLRPVSFPPLTGPIAKCGTAPFHKYRTITLEVKHNSLFRGAHVPMLLANYSSATTFQVLPMSCQWLPENICQLHTNLLTNRILQSEVPSQIPHARFLQRANLVTYNEGKTLSFGLSVHRMSA